uniref:C-type lectin domain-containing protein n=1 Tax=Percolomonas cosmopolitus TaxID=63605 RepID=A0A7S1KU08_9EUKA
MPHSLQKQCTRHCLLPLLISAFLLLILPHCSIIATFVQPQSFNNHEYKLFTEPVSWKDAQQRCAVWGGSLSSIHSAQENDFVKSFSQHPFWIGYNNLQGTWQWCDSTSRSFENWYTVTHEPNNWNNNEHCAELNHHTWGTWNDLNCDTRQSYLCKRCEDSCQWSDDAALIGAPRPVVSTEFQDNHVTIRVQMAKRGNDKVSHALAFSQEVPEVNVNTCNVQDDWKLCDTTVWQVDEDRCETTYTLRLPLQNYIARASPVISCEPRSDIVKITNDLELIYLDETPIEVEDGTKKAHCNVAKFSTEVSFEAVLLTDSHVDFSYEGEMHIVAPTQYTAVSVNDDGKLVIEAILKPTNPEFKFYNFKFHRHSRGLEFFLHWNQFDCDTVVSDVECSYGVSLISRDILSDYSGDIVIEFDFMFGEKVTKTAFNLNLQYNLVEQPNILNNVVGTRSMVVDQDLVTEQECISPFGRAFVLTKTTDALYDSAKLGVKNAYLCCSKGREPLPSYDPGAQSYGCTEADWKKMSVWKQLVKNGEPSEMDTLIEFVGPLINDKTVFSFDPSSLFGEDRLCYIHVTSSLNVVERRRGREDKSDHPLESTFPISFKSCSYFADEKTCLDASVCSWDAELSLCSNIKGVTIEAENEEQNPASKMLLGSGANCSRYMSGMRLVLCSVVVSFVWSIM